MVLVVDGLLPGSLDGPCSEGARPHAHRPGLPDHRMAEAGLRALPGDSLETLM